MNNYRIILLANNIVGLEVAKYLVKKKEKIVALGIHDKPKQKFTDQILKIVNLPKNYVIYGSQINSNSTKKLFEDLKPNIMIAAFWGYLIKPYIFKIPKDGTINLHPGYLPFNRGMNPNVWPFIENTPAGVTIHYIDEGIDTGDIIAQKKIPLSPIDTAGTLEKKTWQEIIMLFKKIWPNLKMNKIKRKKQNNLLSTFHRAKDVSKLDQIFLDKKYTARDLINILKARSYFDRSYAYFIEKGKKVFIKISLSYSLYFK